MLLVCTQTSHLVVLCDSVASQGDGIELKEEDEEEDASGWLCAFVSCEGFVIILYTEAQISPLVC